LSGISKHPAILWSCIGRIIGTLLYLLYCSSWTLKIEVEGSLEASVTAEKWMWHHIAEDLNFHHHFS